MIDLAVTADDFGAAPEVNEAVETAHRRGVLTCASLMIAAPHAADAIERARRLPQLGVGLHLVLVEGTPLLDPARLRGLVDATGHLRRDMVGTAFRIAADATARRGLRAEIDAQFASFAATGLPFDHVNAHKHFHVHPIVAGMVIEAARRHGVPAIRAPISDSGWRGAGWITHPFARSLARRARRVGLDAPVRVYGLAETGRFDEAAMHAAILSASHGLNEIYLHPATRNDYPGATPGYHHRAEFDGLVSSDIRALIDRRRVRLATFRQRRADER